jgi:hypothetical protein
VWRVLYAEKYPAKSARVGERKRRHTNKYKPKWSRKKIELDRGERERQRKREKREKEGERGKLKITTAKATTTSFGDRNKNCK